jgi:hypothetical protein
VSHFSPIALSSSLPSLSPCSLPCARPLLREGSCLSSVSVAPLLLLSLACSFSRRSSSRSAVRGR